MMMRSIGVRWCKAPGGGELAEDSSLATLQNTPFWLRLHSPVRTTVSICADSRVLKKKLTEFVQSLFASGWRRTTIVNRSCHTGQAVLAVAWRCPFPPFKPPALALSSSATHYEPNSLFFCLLLNLSSRHGSVSVERFPSPSDRRRRRSKARDVVGAKTCTSRHAPHRQRNPNSSCILFALTTGTYSYTRASRRHTTRTPHTNHVDRIQRPPLSVYRQTHEKRSTLGARLPHLTVEGKRGRCFEHATG